MLCQRQHRPLVLGEHLDRIWTQPIANCLQRERIDDCSQLVGQFGESYTAFARLPLGPLMPVELHLHWIWKIGTEELDDAGSKSTSQT